jgi:hypothetical protein
VPAPVYAVAAGLAAACILAFPFSNAVPFVAAVGLSQGPFYAAVVSAGDNAAIRIYWAHRYIPIDQGFGEAAGFTPTGSARHSRASASDPGSSRVPSSGWGWWP